MYTFFRLTFLNDIEIDWIRRTNMDRMSCWLDDDVTYHKKNFKTGETLDVQQVSIGEKKRPCRDISAIIRVGSTQFKYIIPEDSVEIQELEEKPR